jgi:hypothetical protein
MRSMEIVKARITNGSGIPDVDVRSSEQEHEHVGFWCP